MTQLETAHLEINELTALINILAAGLSAVPAEPLALTLPVEVSQALAEAREQMNSLPEVIGNLNLATERFQGVAAALTGMMELAERAASEDMDDAGRRRLEEEFVNLAKVVAADAGRKFYQGPSLSLLSPGSALSAAKIVGYMSPVIETLEKELSEQKSLIREVIAETISFLNIVTQCYPEADATLNFLVKTVRPYSQLVSPSLLH